MGRIFIQNQITSLPNHLTKLKDIFAESKAAYLTVAYVKESGVNALQQELKGIIQNKGYVKLICSNDMGITDPQAIKLLLDMGVEVKVFKLDEGTFHAKVWLSNKHDKWYCLVGSANFTMAAFVRNVEASLLIESKSDTSGSVSQALIFFEYLWSSGKCYSVDYEFLKTWQGRRDSKTRIKDQIKEVKLTHEKEAIVKLLLEYAKDWIDIAKEQRQKDEFRESLWRGWYIIPDQDLIDDKTMFRLRDIVKTIILDKDYNKTGYFDISPSSQSLPEIFKLTKNKFKSADLKMDLRSLFIRQEKNYLNRFGFTEHYLKDNGKEDEYKIVVTSLGSNLAKCKNVDEIKHLYSENMLTYRWGNLNIFCFTLELLQRLTYLTIEEFSIFVMHAYSKDEFNEILELINMYRSLAEGEQRHLIHEVNKYFDRIKGPTAKNVRGNYYKHAKYNMSAIGWLEGLLFDDNKMMLKIIDSDKIKKLLEESENELI